jgi:DNA-binding transcriptional LysR family regulator
MHATIELLPFFLAVAEAGSFTGAAAAMNETKSRVSRAIAQLERELDTELFHRTTRAVALTTAGVALFERASPLVEALRDAVGSLPERQETPSGELRITAPTDMNSLMADIVARYVLRWPDVRVDVHLTNRVVDLVKEGFDLGVRATTGNLPDTSLVAKRLARSAGRLYASPKYVARRGTPRDVNDTSHDWLAFIPGRSLAPISSKTTPRVNGNDLLFIRDLIRHGVGVGWLPGFFGEPYVATGELVPVLPSWRMDGGTFYAVYPTRRRLPCKVAAFRDLLVEHMRANPMV